MTDSGIIILIFQLAVLIFSVIIHEVSHGYVAERLGDPTARLAGRLTLNPAKHIDPIGSVILPILLKIAGLPIFGWAKPVPYNPYNLKNPLRGGAIIAAAGPASNFLIAAVFGTFVRLIMFFQVVSFVEIAPFFSAIVFLNLVLGIFNLVPIPPLDGSKVLFALLPKTGSNMRLAFFLEKYGMILVLLFIFFGFQIIVPVINLLFTILTGQLPIF